MKKAELVGELKRIGLEEGMDIEVHSSLSSQDIAYQKGIIKDGYIGKCKYMFFDIWDVVSLYRRELETNPFKLYGLE